MQTICATYWRKWIKTLQSAQTDLPNLKEKTMFNFNKTPTISHELNTLVTDAQAVLQSAADLTGEKADEARARGMQLLDAALSKARVVQEETLDAGKQALASGTCHVRAHPWSSIGIAIATGALIGLAMQRK